MNLNKANEANEANEKIIKIAVLDDYQKIAAKNADWKILETFLAIQKKQCQISFFHNPTTHMTQQQLIEMLSPYQVLCIMRERTPLKKNLLEKLPQLKLIVTSGMRNAAIDITYAKQAGITVCGTASPTAGTSELTMGLMLSLARGLHSQHASVAAGGWQLMPGTTLFGNKLGLLGLGKQGSAVAKLALAFGMDVSAHSTNLTKERCQEVGVKYVSMEELFASSRFISVHLKESPRSQGIVSSKYLTSMRSDAYLINTSRAAIVDYQCLYQLLSQGKIAGAALDVFESEPLDINSPLRTAKNLLLSPHMGYVSQQNYEVYYKESLECVLAFFNRQPIRQLS